jgi:hypothetical protein
MMEGEKVADGGTRIYTAEQEAQRAKDRFANTVGAQCGSAPAVHTVTATVQVRADHTFSTALDAVKEGRKITRSGWNGASQYVEMHFPDKGEKCTYRYLVLRNVHGDFVPWIPSTGDLFASDWPLLPR